MNANYRTKDGQFVLSFAQREQRELAWALYVAEGYAANLGHLLKVNAFTMKRHQLAAVKRAHRDAEKHALTIRQLMGPQS